MRSTELTEENKSCVPELERCVQEARERGNSGKKEELFLSKYIVSNTCVFQNINEFFMINIIGLKYAFMSFQRIVHAFLFEKHLSMLIICYKFIKRMVIDNM